VDPPEQERNGSLHVTNCTFRQGLSFWLMLNPLS
jgi:hypothetical protein